MYFLISNFIILYAPYIGKWLSPQTTGMRPLPCAGFSFTKVDLHRAVLFGGRQAEKRVNEIHILNMENWVCRFCISWSSRDKTP